MPEFPASPQLHTPAARPHSGGEPLPHEATTPFKRIRLRKRKRKRSHARADAAQCPAPEPVARLGSSGPSPPSRAGTPSASAPAAVPAVRPRGEVHQAEFTRIRMHRVPSAVLTISDDDSAEAACGMHGVRGSSEGTARVAAEGGMLVESRSAGSSGAANGGPGGSGQVDGCDERVAEVGGSEQERAPAGGRMAGTAESSGSGGTFGKGNEYDGAYAFESD